MTNDIMLGGLYILMASMLVLGALMARRERFARLATMALAWVAIFAGGFVLFTFRDDLGWVAQRLRAEATGAPVEQGETIRIPMAIDGHFWVSGEINRDQLVRTGNGIIRVASGRADQLAIGPIQRNGMRLHVAQGEDLNVLGMNFLSSLDRWGVEGRWLILQP